MQIDNRLKIQSHIETLWKYFLFRILSCEQFFLFRTAMRGVFPVTIARSFLYRFRQASWRTVAKTRASH